MKDLESLGEASVLTPSLPWNLGVRAQQQRIFDALAKSSAEKTFSATTIADIVGYASISRATFYKHFTNKQECFDATIDTFLDELQAVAGTAYATAGDSQPDAVRMVVSAIVEHLVAKPHHAKLLFIEAAVVDPEAVQRCRALVLAGLERQQTLAAEALASPTDPEAAFGSAIVLVASYLSDGQVEELKSLVPELVYIALRPFAGPQVALAQAQLAR
jgi:AcrR family transcriptional regulator